MCIIQGLDATAQVKHMSDVGVVLSAQYLFSSTESSLVEFTNRNLGSSPDAAQAASDMNDLMDEMLNRSEIPAAYAETMVALFSTRRKKRTPLSPPRNLQSRWRSDVATSPEHSIYTSFCQKRLGKKFFQI